MENHAQDLSEVAAWLAENVMPADDARALSDRLSKECFITNLPKLNECLEIATTLLDTLDCSAPIQKLIKGKLVFYNKKKFKELNTDEVENLINRKFPGKNYGSILKSNVIDVVGSLVNVDNADDLVTFGIFSLIHATALFNYIRSWKSQGVPLSDVMHIDAAAGTVETVQAQISQVCTTITFLIHELISILLF